LLPLLLLLGKAREGSHLDNPSLLLLVLLFSYGHSATSRFFFTFLGDFSLPLLLLGTLGPLLGDGEAEPLFLDHLLLFQCCHTDPFSRCALLL
jgi:hypothetical protein